MLLLINEVDKNKERKKKNSVVFAPPPFFSFASDSYLISQTSILRMYVVRQLPTGEKKKEEDDENFIYVCLF